MIQPGAREGRRWDRDPGTHEAVRLGGIKEEEAMAHDVTEVYDLVEAAARRMILKGRIPDRGQLLRRISELRDRVIEFQTGWNASPVCEVEEVEKALEAETRAPDALVGKASLRLLREIAEAYVADAEEVFGGIEEAKKLAWVFLR